MLTVPRAVPWPAGNSWAWLLGDDVRQRLRLRRTLSAALIYLVSAVFISISVFKGLVSFPVGSTVILYEAAGSLLFYALIRAGINEAFEDPTFTLPQLLHGLGAIVLSYTLIPTGRSLTLPLLSLALTFALLSRLTPRQTMFCGLAASAMMMVAYLLSFYSGHGRSSLTQEAINLIMAALTLPIFSSVSRQVKEWRDRLDAQREALSQSIDALRVLAARDQLTGLVNRRGMSAAIMEELLRFKRHERAFCVAMFDVDDFKRINDQFGHHEGDRVLVSLARHFSRYFSRPDQVARWGGEEFVVLFPESQLAQVHAWLDRARGESDVLVASGTPQAYRVSWSAGVTQSRVGDDLGAILSRADVALYQAKREGKNRVVDAA
jgi:diguanylate cyclase (GGDEF)-like protein